MKIIVNRYSLYSEKDWNKKELNSDILYTGIVFKEDNDFFMEINGKKFIVPSKNGLVKKKSCNSILLNDFEVNKLNKMIETKSD